jgi:hypothetical protein
MNPKLLKSTFCLCVALSILLSACGAGTPVAAEPPPTVTAVPTNTPLPTFTPTVTVTPTETPLPTATPNLAATEQYNDFLALVQTAYDAGQIATLEGRYVKLDDFSDELAMQYGYSWSPTGETARNFILRADFDWEVANQKNNSGCGFKFRQELVSSPGTTSSIEYYYFAILDALNGTLVFYPVAFDYKRAALVNKTDKPDMGANPYHAQFTLIVNDTAAYTYVNGVLFTEHRLQSSFITGSGPLEYVVMTGSDKEYGTRCAISNAELWVID